MKADVDPAQEYPRERQLWWVGKDKRVAVTAVVDIGLLMVLERFCGRTWWVLWLIGSLLVAASVVPATTGNDDIAAAIVGSGVGLIMLAALIAELGNACEHALKEWMKDARDAK